MSSQAKVTVDFYEPVTTDPGKWGKDKDGKDVILEGGRQDEIHYAVGQVVDGEKAAFFVGKGLAEWIGEEAPPAPQQE